MKRGLTIRRKTDERITLERKMITRHYLLELMRDKPVPGCIGCEVCVLACPQEAIEFQPGVVENGRLIQKATIDIDPDKCNFCGECVVLCPVNALRLTINGQVEVPVLQYEAFPELIKKISANGTELRPEDVAACEASCPTEVISVQVERNASGQVTKVAGIQVEESAGHETAGCIYCQQCEGACPGVFTVTKPWQGRVLLDVTRCPEGCQACVDACPTDALLMQEGRLALDERYCLYCSACQRVCPVEGAIVVERARILHTPVKSSAWTSAIERLISPEAAAQEMDTKSQARRRQVLNHMPAVGAPPEASSEPAEGGRE